MSVSPSAVGTPSTVIPEFQELLDQLMDYRGSYPNQMMIKMSDLCSRLKLVGSELELSNKVELDELQNELVKLCQDSFLDLEVRLQILELIELRSFGWKPNKGMEEFYIEKFNEARKAKEMSMKNPESVNVSTSAANKSARNSSPPIEQNKEAVMTKETAASVGAPDSDDVTRSLLMIGSSELALESQDRRLVQLARQQLETFFSRSSGVQVSLGSAGDKEGGNPPLRRPRRLEVEYVAPEAVGSSLKYSREAMLTLANARTAQVTCLLSVKTDTWNFCCPLTVCAIFTGVYKMFLGIFILTFNQFQLTFNACGQGNVSGASAPSI